MMITFSPQRFNIHMDIHITAKSRRMDFFQMVYNRNVVRASFAFFQKLFQCNFLCLNDRLSVPTTDFFNGMRISKTSTSDKIGSAFEYNFVYL